MAQTPSTMLPLGTQLPTFSLPEVKTDQVISSQELATDKPVLVIFLCAHCPFVLHAKDEIARIADDYAEQIKVVAISSNDVDSHPDDSPEQLKQLATDTGWSFPVCYDEDQSVAQAFHAACTPDFFLFDANQELVYRGQLDDSRPGSETPATGSDLRKALDTLLAGEQPDPNQKPSMGCNIKWKPGNEPEYFA
ncbi:MAG: thioredoxin family protein [Patescibacteria group bacterium]